ncbi:hypothetical protein EV2_020462 [Malus domestica]
MKAEKSITQPQTKEPAKEPAKEPTPIVFLPDSSHRVKLIFFPDFDFSLTLDLHHAVTSLSAELYQKDIPFSH